MAFGIDKLEQQDSDDLNLGLDFSDLSMSSFSANGFEAFQTLSNSDLQAQSPCDHFFTIYFGTDSSVKLMSHSLQHCVQVLKAFGRSFLSNGMIDTKYSKHCHWLPLEFRLRPLHSEQDGVSWVCFLVFSSTSKCNCIRSPNLQQPKRNEELETRRKYVTLTYVYCMTMYSILRTI